MLNIIMYLPLYSNELAYSESHGHKFHQASLN